MKFVYVPIDNRPCNVIFPRQLAAMQRIQLSMPPDDIMDDYTHPSDYEALTQWLMEVCDNNTALILSVDNLVHGSLLNSRRHSMNMDTCLHRLDWIRQLKSRYPNLIIYGFSVLMRTSISALSSGDVENWERINEYSQCCYLIQQHGQQEDIRRKAELETLIPADLLQSYLSIRERNATVNQAAVELVHDDVVESLLILQEDSMPNGLQINEQNDLWDHVHRYGLESRVFIHNGTDEGGCLSVAKAVSECCELRLQLSYLYLRDRRYTFIASYEDRLFHQNVLSHATATGIDLVDNMEMADVLVIYTPRQNQYEASLGDGVPPCDDTKSELEAYGQQIADLIKQGKRVYLLDVAYANGGSRAILDSIHQHVPISTLAGYAAWNTASNALGTILAQAVMRQGADAMVNQRFTWERLLDDFAYQGIVRKQLEYLLRSRGEDPLCLEDHASAIVELRRLMRTYLNGDPLFQACPDHVTMTLPWPRIFEAQMIIGEDEDKDDV